MPTPTRDDVDEALRALTRPGALAAVQTIRLYLVEVDRPSRRQDVSDEVNYDDVPDVIGKFQRTCGSHLLEGKAIRARKAFGALLEERDALKADNAALTERARRVLAHIHDKDAPIRPGDMGIEDPSGINGALDALDDAVENPPGAALLERMRLLETLARRGLGLFHGTACSMRGGIRPEDPAECEDERCKAWAKTLEDK